MEDKTTPIFQTFDQHYHSAKNLFVALSKQLKSKKAIELQGELFFLKIYSHLLGKVHFKETQLRFELFDPFREILKHLKKIQHFSQVNKAYTSEKEKTGLYYASYEKLLELEKKSIYKAAYEIIVASPLDIWETLYEEAYNHSQDLRPLMINTGTNQIIQEEIEFLHFDSTSNLDTKAFKDVYEGIQVITALENLRQFTGLNVLFTPPVHDRLKQLSRALSEWYQNQLFIQHFSFFLSEKENISAKYLDLAKKLKQDKKKLTQEVAGQCKYLFTEVLH